MCIDDLWNKTKMDDINSTKKWVKKVKERKRKNNILQLHFINVKFEIQVQLNYLFKIYFINH